MRKNKTSLLLVIAVFILLAVLIYNMMPRKKANGTIVGVVTDSLTGRPVWGTTVKAVDEEGHTSKKKEETTNKEGNFEIDLPEGSYTLQFESAQYKPFESEDLYHVESGKELKIQRTFSLEPLTQASTDISTNSASDSISAVTSTSTSCPASAFTDTDELLNNATATNGSSVGFSSRDFLYTVAAVYQMAHDGNYKYGDSDSVVPCEDKIISGDRLISRSLWNLGLKDQPPGGKELRYLDQYLLDHGFVHITEQSLVQPGDIVVTTADDGEISHNEILVVLSYDNQTGMCYKYQMTQYTPDGELRIKCEQPFYTQLVESYKDRKYRFKIAYRIP